MKLRCIRRSILQNVRLALLGITVLTVILLWLFQIVFLDAYYEAMQKRAVIRAGEDIASNIDSPELNSYLEQLCYDNNMSAVIFSSEGLQITYTDMLGGRDLFFEPLKHMENMTEHLSPIFRGEETSIIRMAEGRGRDKMIIYGQRVLKSNGEAVVIALNSPLHPIGNTTDILKSQMTLIATVLLLLALIVSQMLSRMLITPIQKINEKAKRLADGVYTADYSGEGLLETEELARTLNFSAKGLSKVEELRRELIANVSHDLKTPLTMIRAYAEMIRDITGDDKEKRSEQLDIIIDETERLSDLVNDLIRVSKDENSKRELVIEPIDISALIDDTVGRLSAGCEGYVFKKEYAADNIIASDRHSVAQVLYNLISNAINYTGEDKIVTVRTICIGNKLRTEVRDTGRGISEKELPLIWERYYRSENTHQRPIAGSGLGLSIVRGSLEALGSEFGVESVEGEGSCFWFEAPLCEEKSDG